MKAKESVLLFLFTFVSINNILFLSSKIRGGGYKEVANKVGWLVGEDPTKWCYQTETNQQKYLNMVPFNSCHVDVAAHVSSLSSLFLLLFYSSEDPDQVPRVQRSSKRKLRSQLRLNQSQRS